MRFNEEILFSSCGLIRNLCSKYKPYSELDLKIINLSIHYPPPPIFLKFFRNNYMIVIIDIKSNNAIKINIYNKVLIEIKFLKCLNDES
jgi:hypothetical protein